MDRQGEQAGETGTVRVVPEGAQDLAVAVEAAGWRIDAADPLVIVADARADLAHVAAEDLVALDTRAALLAVIAPGGAMAACGAGATHVAEGVGDLAEALCFAARHGRRLRGQGRARRLADLADARVPGRFIERHAATGVSVVVAALTSFEIVNNAFGRAAGDLLVRAAEARIARAMAGIETAMLRDGSAFTIAAAGPPALVTVAVSAIERALAEPFALGEETIHVGARIGVAHGGAGEPAKQLLRRAAEALARARGSDGAMTQVSVANEGTPLAELAADLHRAIDRHEIDVLFQPQVAMADGAVIGAEALMRWRHPRLGELGAERLLDAAERAGLVPALSAHVHARALAAVAGWPGGLRLSLNVTAEDLAEPGFDAALAERVAASGFPAERVTLEVTERGLIEEPRRAAAVLNALRAAGFRTAIDDFGTGYSSIAYLSQLPLDYLKLDRVLTQDMAAGQRDRTVVTGVIELAHSLGLTVIAEGVETEQQRDLLARAGVAVWQGFLCAGPVGAADVAALAGG